MEILERTSEWLASRPFFDRHPVLTGVCTVAIFAFPLAVLVGFIMGKLL